MDDQYEAEACLTAVHVLELSEIYAEWVNQYKVPMEEMYVLHSNSDPSKKSMNKNGTINMENKIWDYRIGEDGEYRITYRMGRVLTMLLRAEFEIMTLVELDCYDYFKVIMEALGFDSAFQAKLGQIESWLLEKKFWKPKLTPGKKFWHRSDGAAVFWLKDRFEALERNKIEDKCNCLKQTFSKPDYHLDAAGKKQYEEGHHFEHNADMSARHHNIFIGEACQGKQVVMDMVFKIKNTPYHFALITGHLKSGKQEKDVPKKKTIVECVAERAKYLRHKTKFTLTTGQLLPVMISGDINTPSDTETFKHLINVLMFKIKKRQVAAYKDTHLPICVMQSSYDIEMPTKFAERRAGNQPEKIMKVIETEDYQLHTIDIMSKSQMYLRCKRDIHGFEGAGITFLKAAEEVFQGGFPGLVVPSDHIPLGTIFELKKILTFGWVEAMQHKRKQRRVITKTIAVWKKLTKFVTVLERFSLRQKTLARCDMGKRLNRIKIDESSESCGGNPI